MITRMFVMAWRERKSTKPEKNKKLGQYRGRMSWRTVQELWEVKLELQQESVFKQGIVQKGEKIKSWIPSFGVPLEGRGRSVLPKTGPAAEKGRVSDDWG